MVDPPFLPNTAEKDCDCTLNSCTASGDGWMENPPVNMFFESTPSISTLLPEPRNPFDAYVTSLKGEPKMLLENPPRSGTVPAINSGRLPKRRVLSGNSVTCRVSTVKPTEAVPVSTIGAVAVASTVCERVPTLS